MAGACATGRLTNAPRDTHTQIIGFTHMRIADGVTTQLQLAGMLASMCSCALATGIAGKK